jgi:hypothetical protein
MGRKANRKVNAGGGDAAAGGGDAAAAAPPPDAAATAAAPKPAGGFLRRLSAAVFGAPAPAEGGGAPGRKLGVLHRVSNGALSIADFLSSKARVMSRTMQRNARTVASSCPRGAVRRGVRLPRRDAAAAAASKTHTRATRRRATRRRATRSDARGGASGSRVASRPSLRRAGFDDAAASHPHVPSPPAGSTTECAVILEYLFELFLRTGRRAAPPLQLAAVAEPDGTRASTG